MSLTRILADEPLITSVQVSVICFDQVRYMGRRLPHTNLFPMELWGLQAEDVLFLQFEALAMVLRSCRK